MTALPTEPQPQLLIIVVVTTPCVTKQHGVSVTRKKLPNVYNDFTRKMIDFDIFITIAK